MDSNNDNIGKGLNLKNIHANATKVPHDKKITLTIKVFYSLKTKSKNPNLTLIHEDKAYKMIMRVNQSF